MNIINLILLLLLKGEIIGVLNEKSGYNYYTRNNTLVNISYRIRKELKYI